MLNLFLPYIVLRSSTALMAILPTSPSSLELTISIPGFASSPYLPSSEGGACGTRNLDINQVPLTMEEEEEESSGGPPRKKLRLTKEQSRLLEESFRENHTLNPKQKEALAYQLKLLPRQVEVWFQNRRARTKLKQTEMECEYLKRCFGSLTEENRRLHREVEQLRALRVGPPTVISPNTCEPLPASTLTMCPRCERVTTANSGASATAGTTTSGTTTATLDKHGPTCSKSLAFSRQPSAAC